ncbi:MAG TPA: SDR family NAD(P)-dependent oxidoreductase [Rhodanobacteraceae bacterium]|nr:SDR family NAD(P)-dependent oxidoreductase [Rhodanobacteraceae bacterium]
MSLPRHAFPADWQAQADSLADRVVLVTGPSGGLGRAAALACQAAGATVVLAGRKVRKLEKVYDELKALGGAEPAIFPIDLAGASPRDYDSLVEALEREFGRLDGVVHAAAHFAGLTPLTMEKPDNWLLDLQVNLTAPLLLTQALQPLLMAAPDPALVYLLDDPERLARAHWNGYGVAKAGLERMVAILHAETATSKLRVHALLPAPMRTGLRRLAWFAEDASAIALPEASAPAVVYLLAGAGGASARGGVLDLRAEAAGCARGAIASDVQDGMADG